MKLFCFCIALFLLFIAGVASPCEARQNGYGDPLVPKWHRSRSELSHFKLEAAEAIPTLSTDYDVIGFVVDTGLDPIEFGPNLLPNPQGGYYGFSIFGGTKWANTSAHGNAVAWRLRFRFGIYLQMHGLDPSLYHLWIVPLQNGTDATGPDFARTPSCEAYAIEVMKLFPGIRSVWNLSYGGGGYLAEEDLLMAEASFRGAVVVTTARNQAGEDPTFPLGYGERIAQIGVGASTSDANGVLHVLSGYGPNVRVFAPGNLVQVGPGSLGSGSSFAAPDVAAWTLASMLKSPTMSPWDFIQLIAISALKSDELDGKVFSGGGFFAPERAFSSQYLVLLRSLITITFDTVKPAKVIASLSQDEKGYIPGQRGAKVKSWGPNGKGGFTAVAKRLAEPAKWISIPSGGTVAEVKAEIKQEQ